MLQIGQHHELIFDRMTSAGAYLVNELGDDVLLPFKYVPESAETGDRLRVFIYLDNLGRPIATTLEPLLTLGQFGLMKVSEVNRFGAFLDWGIEKELLVPFREQGEKMERGRSYVVYLFEDRVTNRLVASARLGKFVELEDVELEEGEMVDALITRSSDLGTMAIINDEYQGLFYRNETFKNLRAGQVVKAYVKQVREDGKVDLVLEKPGYAHVEPNALRLLEIIKSRGGYLRLHDKSDPKDIQQQLEMSKKTFKKAVGALYKQRLIEVVDEGIRLVQP